MTKTTPLHQFEKWTKDIKVSLKTLFPTIQKDVVYHIDLSKTNTTVSTEEEFNNPKFFGNKLDEIQEQNPTQIITGGYLEKRALYTSDIYNAPNTDEKRNIHLGVDFWLPSLTPVHAIFDGKVVCSTHQKPYKGYGGFVILEHTFEGLTFYTLYGHLAKESVQKLQINDEINKGELIGLLGNYEENGEWVPHLHFQVMLDLLDYTDDFPGVALESEIEYWKTICPNPNLLFKQENL